MIGTIDVTVQAARPDLPLPPVRAFVGSPSSVRVRNVPRRIGEWDITRVFVTANYPDSTTETAECVLTGGVWVGTVLGCSTPGTSLSGFVVTADGVDEHGSTVSGYILGVGDVIVLTREESATPGVITFKGDKGDKGDPGDVISVNGKVGAVSIGANDVGAYTKGETDAALENKLDKTAFADHTENTNNPHNVTAAQVGAVSISRSPDSDQTFDWSPSGVDGYIRLFGTYYKTGIGLGLWSGGGSLFNYHDDTSDIYQFPTGESGTLALTSDIEDAVNGKVGSFESVGGASATIENGVAKLSDFFTESNSLLTGTIDAEVISKGTAPDAHLEAPTDEHLKLILADNSVAYDSAKALPYKLTSVIGDRVIATMTLTAASTDITLPTIAANDTTVKDFILDVTNAYAVEGVATDAGINIPRTDFKLVTRDGESLTDVTTVKAGKSAFICFTQKSPVVVGGTTYPCWCVIQLPFGDPS